MKKTIRMVAMALSALLCFATTGAYADGVSIKFEANGNSTTREVAELPHTFVCDYDTTDGDFDAILRELYGWEQNRFATYCDPDKTPESADSAKVVAQKNNKNHEFVIGSEFEGEVAVSGQYVAKADGTPYSVTISFAAVGTELTPTANENEWTFTMPAEDVNLKVAYYTEDELAVMNVEALIDAIGEVEPTARRRSTTRSPHSMR